MTEQRPVRERLRELAAKATPGPWCVDDEGSGAFGTIFQGREWTEDAPWLFDRATDGKVADSRLAVEAVNALPALLDELDTLERRAISAERLNLARLERFIDFTSGKPQYVTANGIPQDIPRRFHKDILDLRAALAKTSGDTRDG